MEVVEEYLNSRLSSLIKRISECEEERKSILLEVKTFKNTAGNTEAGGVFGEKCESLETTLETLVVTIRNCEKCEVQSEKKTTRKCRYFNRGYCKYRERCRFYHSPNICKVYLEKGICRKNSCSDRHPRKCKYKENCPRYEQCQYLHVESEKVDEIDDVAGGEIPCDDCPYDQENGHEMRMNIERTHEERRPYNCDVRDSDKDNRDSHRKHTETEYEESYFAVMGDGGRIQFVCKLCDASFSLQKAINEHNMVKRNMGASCR